MLNMNRFRTIGVMLALAGSLAACDAISGRETPGAKSGVETDVFQPLLKVSQAAGHPSLFQPLSQPFTNLVVRVSFTTPQLLLRLLDLIQ